MKKRIFSILLAVCLAVSAVPVSVLAEETPVYYCGQEDHVHEDACMVDPLANVKAVQALIDALPPAEEITQDTLEDTKAKLAAIDTAKAALQGSEPDQLVTDKYTAASNKVQELASAPPAAPVVSTDQPSAKIVSVTIGSTTTYYATINEAVTKAAEGNSVITLLDNVTATGFLDFTKNTHVLNLGTYTLSASENTNPVISVSGSANVTLQGSAGGKLTGPQMGVAIGAGAVFAMESGTIETTKVAVSNGGGTVNIRGGIITSDTTALYTRKSYSGDTAGTSYVSGGTLLGNEQTLEIEKATLYVSGNSIIQTGTNGKTMRFGGNTNVQLSGGSFPGGITTNYSNAGGSDAAIPTLGQMLADNYGYYQNGSILTGDALAAKSLSGAVTVKPAVCTHESSEVNPNTGECTCGHQFGAKFTANDGTVTYYNTDGLGTAITGPGTITLYKDCTIVNAFLDLYGDITLSTGQHKLTGHICVGEVDGSPTGSLTLKGNVVGDVGVQLGSSFHMMSGSVKGVVSSSGESVVIDQGTIENPAGYAALSITAGTAEIKDGTIKGNIESHSGTVYIKAGDFTLSSIASVFSVIHISGGTFHFASSAGSTDQTIFLDGVQLSGGTFPDGMTTNGNLYECLAPGYTLMLTGGTNQELGRLEMQQEVPEGVKIAQGLITQQPVSPVTIPYGGTQTLSVTARGTDATYQWEYLKDEPNATPSNISGATGNTYSLPTDLTPGHYLYVCKVTKGSVTQHSTPALVIVEKPKLSFGEPVMVQQPKLGDTPVHLVGYGTKIKIPIPLSAGMPAPTGTIWLDVSDEKWQYYSYSSEGLEYLFVPGEKGTYTFTLSYSGDDNYQNSEYTFTLEVSELSVSVAGVPAPGQILTPSVTFPTEAASEPDAFTYLWYVDGAYRRDENNGITLTQEDVGKQVYVKLSIPHPDIGNENCTVTSAPVLVEEMFHFKNNYPVEQTYDGTPFPVPTEEQMELLGISYEDLTFSWKDSEGNDLPGAPVNAGTYQLFATCRGVSPSITVTITQAAAAPAMTATKEVRYSDAGEQSVSIKDLLAENAAYVGKKTYMIESVGNTNGIFLANNNTSITSDGILKFKINNDASLVGKEGTIVVRVLGLTNFVTLDVNVTVRVIDKQAQSSALQLTVPTTAAYGDPAFTLSTSGGSGTGSVRYESSNTDILAITGSEARILGSGTVTITAIKEGDSQYNETRTSATVTIQKKTITIKANDVTIQAGLVPTYSYTAPSLAQGDTLTNVTVSSPTADLNTLGTYPIVASGGVLSNQAHYDVRYEPGTLTVVSRNYTMIQGAQQNVVQGNEAVFVSDAPHTLFAGLLVDGTAVDPANFRMTSGSTKVTLNAAYTRQLSVGQHTLAIVSSNGQAATAFSVSRPPVAYDSYDYDSPRTGDTTHTTAWYVLAAIGLAGLLVSILGKRYLNKRR